MTMTKMSCYRQFIRVFNFNKENYRHDIPFFETSIKKVIYYKTYFSLDL